MRTWWKLGSGEKREEGRRIGSKRAGGGGGDRSSGNGWKR